MTTQDFSYQFVNELFQCHGLLMDIVNEKDTKFFFMEKYPPLVLEVKWAEVIYKVVQYYIEYCKAVPNKPSQFL